MHCDVIIIGAGPAGLSAAHALCADKKVIILEADAKCAGGLAKKYGPEFNFTLGADILAKDEDKISQFFSAMAGSKFAKSAAKIALLNKHIFHLPLSYYALLRHLGFKQSWQIFYSKLSIKLDPLINPDNCEATLINVYGKHLFNAFVKNYMEKIVGKTITNVKFTHQLQTLPLMQIFTNKNDLFDKSALSYPTFFCGSSDVWQSCADRVCKLGGDIMLDAVVYRCTWQLNHWEVYFFHAGSVTKLTATHLINTAPLKNFIAQYLQPAPSAKLLQAAKKMLYRSLVVAIIPVRKLYGNWQHLQVHDQQLDVAHIKNYTYQQSEGAEYIGLYYYCYREDALWRMSEDAIYKKACAEIQTVNLAEIDLTLPYQVVKEANALPWCEDQELLTFSRNLLEKKFPALKLAGLHGNHEYMTQAAAIKSGWHAADAILNASVSQTVVDNQPVGVESL